MSPLPAGPLSPQEEADWRDIARAHRDGTSMTSRFFATLDAARADIATITEAWESKVAEVKAELRRAMKQRDSARSELHEARARATEWEVEATRLRAMTVSRA